MAEDRLKILEMLAAGKISAAEANDLLESVKTKDETRAVNKKRFLKVRVSEGGKEKVNVNVPLSLAKLILKFIPENAREEMVEKGIDLENLVSSLTDEFPMGKIVSVEDGDDNVEIYVE